MMQGRAIVVAIAFAGWFVAALVAFVIVALFDFLGVGLVGVLIAFVATQFELESGGIAGAAYGASMISVPVGASAEEPALAMKTCRHRQALLRGRELTAIEAAGVANWRPSSSGLAGGRSLHLDLTVSVECSRSQS